MLYRAKRQRMCFNDVIMEMLWSCHRDVLEMLWLMGVWGWNQTKSRNGRGWQRGVLVPTNLPI